MTYTESGIQEALATVDTRVCDNVSAQVVGLGYALVLAAAYRAAIAERDGANAKLAEVMEVPWDDDLRKAYEWADGVTLPSLTEDRLIKRVVAYCRQAKNLATTAEQSYLDALKRNNANMDEWQKALVKAENERDEANDQIEKQSCGHPLVCFEHEQGPEDADEVCLWCAQLGAAAQVADYEKNLLGLRIIDLERDAVRACDRYVAAEDEVEKWKKRENDLATAYKDGQVELDIQDHKIKELKDHIYISIAYLRDAMFQNGELLEWRGTKDFFEWVDEVLEPTYPKAKL